MLRLRLISLFSILLLILPSEFLSGQASVQDKTLMTNQDVIRLAKAKVGEDIIIAKIRQSKTKFDLSTDAIVQLKTAGVSDRVLAAMMDHAADTGETKQPTKQSVAGPSLGDAKGPPTKLSAEPRITPNPTNPKSPPTPPRTTIAHAPTSYGLYIEKDGQLLPIGRVQTKVQLSKWRSLLGTMVPLVRRKIDINITGAHSAHRFDVERPTFYAYFPPVRDISKFKLLQAKITGQRFDQRTVASASILFSTEQNQDEILCDIGPTEIKDLYRISPREDLPSGEFGFVEGNTGTKSTSNIEIIDVFDFGIDRKEDKLALKEYLDTLPPTARTDATFHSWTKEECQKLIADREGKIDVGGAMLGWFKRQYASLAVYWVDGNFARAFARLEMLDRDLTPEQASKLSVLLQSADQSQYFVMVSIGQKVGSGRLIGANEGERTMRPYDSTLYNPKSKDVIVAARRLEPVGGYAGIWKVSFDSGSAKTQVLDGAQEVIFEARLNQNLDLKASFKTDNLSSKLAQQMR